MPGGKVMGFNHRDPSIHVNTTISIVSIPVPALGLSREISIVDVTIKLMSAFFTSERLLKCI